MAKSKVDKKVNREIKKLNKQLKDDVFGNRFWLRQYQKSYLDGINYYLYELCDREQPERNMIVTCGWLTSFAILKFHDLYLEMNNFIIESNFWELYHKNNN